MEENKMHRALETSLAVGLVAVFVFMVGTVFGALLMKHNLTGVWGQ